MVKILGIEIGKDKDGKMTPVDMKEMSPEELMDKLGGKGPDRGPITSDEITPEIKTKMVRANRLGFYATPMKIAKHIRETDLKRIGGLISLNALGSTLGMAIGEDMDVQSAPEIEAMKEATERLGKAVTAYIDEVRALSVKYGYGDDPDREMQTLFGEIEEMRRPKTAPKEDETFTDEEGNTYRIKE